MNLRRIARSIAGCIEGTPARVQVYRVLVAEVAEPGALEQLWGLDRHLDREIVQWCRDQVPDPLALPPPHRDVADPCEAVGVARSRPSPTEVTR